MAKQLSNFALIVLAGVLVTIMCFSYEGFVTTFFPAGVEKAASNG